MCEYFIHVTLKDSHNVIQKTFSTFFINQTEHPVKNKLIKYLALEISIIYKIVRHFF